MKQVTVWSVIALCVIVYLLGWHIPLMDVDASQYASITREMLEKKSYLQLYDLNRNYLDKPPMLFWLSALSIKLLGVYDWAFRLPSFLFALLAVYSTYKFALLFYKKETAQLSAVVLATSQALMLINHDVRTDTMLMGWTIFSIWQLAAWYRDKEWKHLLLAFISIAGGMMTKGPIALMVPVFAFAPHFILKREWKQFFRWEYILGLIIIAILLIPMSIGLYEQYDMHPGKLINGLPIRSGLRFYYWTQSFGRITGESSWNENGSFFFLLQNMLWSFLPWIIFFLIGLVVAVKQLFQQRFRLMGTQEWITIGGFILTYCALGSSKYQLPHYIFVAYPFAAIITANFLQQLLFDDKWVKWRKALYVFHFVVFILLWIVLLALLIIPFATIPKYLAVMAAIAFVVMIILLSTKKIHQKLLFVCIYSIIGINLFLNTGFYPALLQYQMGNTAASFIEENHLPKDKVYLYGREAGHSFHFYSNHIYSMKTQPAQLQAGDYVVVWADSIPSLQHNWPGMEVLYQHAEFGVSMLTLPFLNPKTRDKEVRKYAIIALKAK